MIAIKEKKDCCGCGACVQSCPRNCITMHPDHEGFLYPRVNISNCTDCGLCERVCPVLSPGTNRKPVHTYIAKNLDDDVRQKSSSGGIFTLLAEKTLAAGGTVFGAKWNEDWELVHSGTDCIEGTAAFRGSKYLQSRTENVFGMVKHLLKEGRPVLFSGTPCQVAGLRRYLRRDYEHLLLVDFICHGAPSPGVFRHYLKEEIEKVARQSDEKNSVSSPLIHPVSERDTLNGYKGYFIQGISFRDKRKGWKKFSFALTLSKVSAAGEKNTVSLSYTLDKHAFMRGFLQDLYLRPSCHACPAKCLSSGADITLGDFWGAGTLRPDLDDDKGLSAVTANTERGLSALLATKAELHEVEYEELVKRNPAILRSAIVPAGREKFFTEDGLTFHEKIEKFCKLTFKTKCRRNLRRFIAACLGNKGDKIIQDILNEMRNRYHRRRMK